MTDQERSELLCAANELLLEACADGVERLSTLDDLEYEQAVKAINTYLLRFQLAARGGWCPDDTGHLRQCIREARAHVVRQQFAGKHEQDRADAVEWLERWGELVESIADQH
jgi:hypothetical protein